MNELKNSQAENDDDALLASLDRGIADLVEICRNWNCEPFIPRRRRTPGLTPEQARAEKIAYKRRVLRHLGTQLRMILPIEAEPSRTGLEP